MLRFAARRVLHAVPIAWLVATLVFSLLHLVPGDPVESMLGENASAADVAALRARLLLDRPLGEQYARARGGLLRGDLGTSLQSGRPVRGLVAERWPATLALALASLGLALALALPLGVLAARRPGGAADRAASTLAFAGASLPTF